MGVVATDAGHPTFGPPGDGWDSGARRPRSRGTRCRVGKPHPCREIPERSNSRKESRRPLCGSWQSLTDQARFGMSAQPPLQVGIASGGVAGEAIPAARVANVRHRLALRVQAPSPVAAFAVRVVDRHRDLPVARPRGRPDILQSLREERPRWVRCAENPLDSTPPSRKRPREPVRPRSRTSRERLGLSLDRSLCLSGPLTKLPLAPLGTNSLAIRHPFGGGGPRRRSPRDQIAKA